MSLSFTPQVFGRFQRELRVLACTPVSVFVVHHRQMIGMIKSSAKKAAEIVSENGAASASPAPSSLVQVSDHGFTPHRAAGASRKNQERGRIKIDGVSG